MFPYRRNVKKRTKNGPQQRRGAQHSGQGQRIPGSARELLRLLQPTTKALAQLLAGNAQPSGQLNHAWHVLEQAQRVMADRQVEHLTPHEREEFLEQFARLKLTLADAHDMEQDHHDRQCAEAERPVKPAIAPERLREMALALSSAAPAKPQEPVAPPPVVEEPPVALEETRAEPAENDDAEGEARSGPRGQRLRLKRSNSEAAPVG